MAIYNNLGILELAILVHCCAVFSELCSRHPLDKRSLVISRRRFFGPPRARRGSPSKCLSPSAVPPGLMASNKINNNDDDDDDGDATINNNNNNDKKKKKMNNIDNTIILIILPLIIIKLLLILILVTNPPRLLGGAQTLHAVGFQLIVQDSMGSYRNLCMYVTNCTLYNSTYYVHYVCIQCIIVCTYTYHIYIYIYVWVRTTLFWAQRCLGGGAGELKQ